jgi:hypothetical protein
MPDESKKPKQKDRKGITEFWKRGACRDAYGQDLKEAQKKSFMCDAVCM